MDKIIAKTSHLWLMERDGWYYYARIPGSAGGVILLLYRTNSDKPILGRYEICPAHGDMHPTLTTIAGGINVEHTPLQAAIQEAYEEAGYKLDTMLHLGTCMLSTNQDTVIHMFVADVTDLPRYEAPGDGTRSEAMAYCDWVDVRTAVLSKSAYMSTLLLRLKLLLGVDLL